MSAATSGAAPMEMRGRPLRGWLLVDHDELQAEPDLARWVGVGVGYVRTLPPKAQNSGIPDALG